MEDEDHRGHEGGRRCERCVSRAVVMCLRLFNEMK